MMELFGAMGAFFFAICAFPQVYQVWKTQETKALSLSFLIFWALGEIWMWVYIIMQNAETGLIQWPLHINYFVNALSLVYLLYKKLTEKR
jgi:uncharacterized protein with PQ loop repeat